MVSATGENYMSKKNRIIIAGILLVMTTLSITGCVAHGNAGSENEEMKDWLKTAELQDHYSAEELYQKALKENTLVVYSVSSRAFDAKETFEKEYPGLTVDVRDIRGDDIIKTVLSNYENNDYSCDLIICSDCDGSLYKELLEPGLAYSYIPWDISNHLRENDEEQGMVFLGEAMMLIYNDKLFKTQPIQNIWEMTEKKFKGKIIMASPLSSFSTYGFCATVIAESEIMKQSYEEYFGEAMIIPEGKQAGEIFWEMVSPNIVFTNSSDEVMEGVGSFENTDYWLGVMISSKLRYRELGYHLTPIYNLEPFAAVYTPNSVSIAGGSQNINSAKLFIRYLLGETDGKGEGILPFTTLGTWSAREDVADGDIVPLSQLDVKYLNKKFIYENRQNIIEFWETILKENVTQ